MSDFWKAYPAAWARARAMRAQAARWHRQGLLLAGQHAAIEAAYPIEYYRPAWPVRVGLFLFAWLGMALAGAFLAMITSSASSQHDSSPTTLGCLMTIGCLGLLWWFIREQKSYYSGLDTALLYGGLGAALGTLWYLFDAHQRLVGDGLGNSPLASAPLLLVTLAVLLVAVVRYADPLVTACAYVAAGFLGLTQLGFLAVVLPRAGTVVFFGVVTGFGAAALALHRYLRARVDTDYYAPALLVLKVLALATIYLGGNYFVVREIGSASSYPILGQVPLAPLFYVFTALIPLLYLYLGLRRADRVLLLLGLLALGFSLFTLRHYHSVMPPEWAATLGGIVLIGGAGFGLRYLRPQRHRLTSEPDDEPRFFNLESLVVAETATVPTGPPATGFAFGGGQSGGGGATGQF